MDWENHERLVVCCKRCEEVHVAIERADGALSIVGNAQRCRRCGHDEFRRVEYSLLEDEPDPAEFE